MGRLYTNTSGLNEGVSGFMDARKQKQDELYRQATQQLAAQEAALLKMGGYMRPSAPKDGYSSGYEENQDNIGRDQGSMESLAPQFFKKVVNPAQPAQPAVVNELTPSGVPIKTFPDEPQRSPQSGPMPLLKGKETTKLDPLAAQADKVIYNEADKKLVGQKPDGTDVYAAPAAKTELSGLPGVALEGSPAVPAQPEVAQNFDPSPMMRAKIQDRITSQAAKDTDPEIPVSSLPPNLRAQLGIPEDFQGSIRSSILKEMIQGSYKAQPKSATQDSIHESVYEAADSILRGVPVAVAARAAMVKKQGPLTPKESDFLKSMVAQRGTQVRSDTNIGLRTQLNEENKLRTVGQDMDKTGINSALPALKRIDELTGALTKQTINKSKLPGYGTNLARSIPVIGPGLSTVMSKQYGGEEVNQALQVLLNAQVKNQAGSNVTRYEEGRQLVAAGMGPGGDEESVSKGLKLMAQGIQEATNSVRARYNPSVLRAYEAAGGNLSLVDQLMKKEAPLKKGETEVPKEKNSAYEAELQDARQRLNKKREEFQAEMANGGTNARIVSKGIEELKSKVDQYLREKYGKGFSE